MVSIMMRMIIDINILMVRLMKKFLYFFIILICTLSLLAGCGINDKGDYEADLVSYAAFKNTIDSLDSSDFAAYVSGISQAVEDFDCSTDECMQLKQDFVKIAGLLESYQVSLDSDALDDSAYEDLDSRMEELTASAQEHTNALRTAAEDAGVKKKFIRNLD